MSACVILLHVKYCPTVLICVSKPQHQEHHCAVLTGRMLNCNHIGACILHPTNLPAKLESGPVILLQS